MSLPTEPALPESAERDPHEPDVLRLLLDNHAQFLGFLERRVGSRDEAEDILQEAFVRSIDRAELLRSPESAVAWFYRVLRNAIVDHHRRQGTQSRAFARLAAETDGMAAGPDEELEAVACACVLASSGLSPKPRTVSSMHERSPGGCALRQSTPYFAPADL